MVKISGLKRVSCGISIAIGMQVTCAYLLE